MPIVLFRVHGAVRIPQTSIHFGLIGKLANNSHLSFQKSWENETFFKKDEKKLKKKLVFLYLYHRSSCRVWCERISSLRSKICITFSFSRYLCILVKYYPATNSKRTFVISYKVLMTKVVFFSHQILAQFITY